jgi:hypothetical protein
MGRSQFRTPRRIVEILQDCSLILTRNILPFQVIRSPADPCSSGNGDSFQQESDPSRTVNEKRGTRYRPPTKLWPTIVTRPGSLASAEISGGSGAVDVLVPVLRPACSNGRERARASPERMARPATRFWHDAGFIVDALVV